MLTFPAIAKPSYPFSIKLENPAIQSQMENGIVVSRPRYTRIRKIFNLKWNALSAADYALLYDFWKNQTLGGSLEFQWTYPTLSGDPCSGQTFTVRFSGEELQFDLIAPGIYSGQVVIVEV